METGLLMKRFGEKVAAGSLRFNGDDRAAYAVEDLSPIAEIGSDVEHDVAGLNELSVEIQTSLVLRRPTPKLAEAPAATKAGGNRIGGMSNEHGVPLHGE
jgi:hypothetical protein